MHERAGERYLRALALRKALGAALGELGDVEQFHYLVDAVVNLCLVEPAESCEIGDVLARREVRIQAGTVRQGADFLARAQAVGRHVVAIDVCAAAVGFQYRVKNAERRGLAGPVGTQQPGNFSVRRIETYAANCLYLAERLVNVSDGNHGAGPEKSRKKGMTKLRSRHWSSITSGSAAATKSATRRLVQVHSIAKINRREVGVAWRGDRVSVARQQQERQVAG